MAQERTEMGVRPSVAPAADNPRSVTKGTVTSGAVEQRSGSTDGRNVAHLILAPRQGMKENTTSRFRAGAKANPLAIGNGGSLNCLHRKPGAMPRAVFQKSATVGCTFTIPISRPESVGLYGVGKPVRQLFCAVRTEGAGMDTRLSSARRACGAF
jgi:hypothetical protein